MLKTAVFTPIPNARHNTAKPLKAGDLRIKRNENLRSCKQPRMDVQTPSGC
jgi:hypothetical protein